MGSLRAGGATWLLERSENLELVRRRGRWISSKSVEIYIQESSSAQFVPLLDPAVKDAGGAPFPIGAEAMQVPTRYSRT